MIENQLKQLKKKAKEYCDQVNLDGAIRTICKSNLSRGDSVNRCFEIVLPNGKTLVLRATWGAGCNGAYARYEENSGLGYHLYECLDYGRHLSAFQNGEWVEVVLSLAKQEFCVQQAQKQIAEMKRLQAELLKWMPADGALTD